MGFFDLFRKKEETDVERYQRELNERREETAPAEPGHSCDHLLQVEDVFSIAGRGTVVTGRCIETLTVHDLVTVVNPNGTRYDTEVTGIEMFRKVVDCANPGDNVGVLLRGLTRAQVERGALLTRA